MGGGCLPVRPCRSFVGVRVVFRRPTRREPHSFAPLNVCRSETCAADRTWGGGRGRHSAPHLSQLHFTSLHPARSTLRSPHPFPAWWLAMPAPGSGYNRRIPVILSDQSVRNRATRDVSTRCPLGSLVSSPNEPDGSRGCRRRPNRSYSCAPITRRKMTGRRGSTP